MFTKILSIACFIILFAIQASAQGPQVQSKPETPSTAEPQESAEQENGDSQDFPVTELEPGGQLNKADSENKGQESAEQMTESWVSLFGLRMQLTNFLVSLFTFCCSYPLLACGSLL
ncbi:MAG: hypothetical protein IH901_03455 [Proteobacteria bacterium]|nr:hypothetical protein [Pseudomonadota bacterium]